MHLLSSSSILDIYLFYLSIPSIYVSSYYLSYFQIHQFIYLIYYSISTLPESPHGTHISIWDSYRVHLSPIWKDLKLKFELEYLKVFLQLPLYHHPCTPVCCCTISIRLCPVVLIVCSEGHISVLSPGIASITVEPWAVNIASIFFYLELAIAGLI